MYRSLLVWLIIIGVCVYSYNEESNQLNSVIDTGTDNIFPKNSLTNCYTYYKDGNLKSDNIKGITEIIYDFNNMPLRILAENGEDAMYHYYDLEGIKHRKTIGLDSIDYNGSFVYKNSKLAYITLADGRLVSKDGDWEFEYHLKDHLGNSRTIFAALVPGVPIIKQQHDYYPFGLLMNQNRSFSVQKNNKYLYNGKELYDDEISGLKPIYLKFNYKM